MNSGILVGMKQYPHLDSIAKLIALVETGAS
jgi:hypothetical protein